MQKLGVIGTGKISAIYIENLNQKFKNSQVVACASLHFEHAITCAKQHHILALTIDELLTYPEIDTIICLTPVPAHFELGVRTLSNGKHFYCEKTLCETSQQAKKLFELAQTHQLKIGCAPDTFLGPAIQKAKDIIQSGIIGDITGFTIQMTRNTSYLIEDFTFLTLPGAGMVYDFGVYALTTLCYLLGNVSQVQSFCHVVNDFDLSELHRIHSENELIVAANLKLTSGIIGTVMLNGHSIFPERPYFSIQGTRGIIELPDPNSFGGEITLHLPITKEALFSSSKQIEKISYFFNEENLRGIGFYDMIESEDYVSFKRAYHTLTIIEGIITSAKHHTTIHIETI